MRKYWFLFGAMLLFTGFGCTNPLAVSEKAATDIVMSSGTALVLEETTAGFDNPFTTEDVTKVTVTLWEDAQAKLAWKKTEQQETESSRTAREQALRAPVGSNIPVPDLQYEQVTVAGTLHADGRLEGTHIEVPATWASGDHELLGEGNGLLWLSKEQYTLLAQTRQATVILGNGDSILSALVSYYEQAEGLIEKLQGGDQQPAEAIASLTTLTAEADWGSYDVVYGGEKVRVQTLVAENAFARFEILANAENPLILSFVPRPASWVAVALQTLHPDIALEGYNVTQISPSNVDQLQPEVQ